MPVHHAPLCSHAGLTWGIRGSFLTYLHSLADGSIDLSDDATTTADGLFCFPFLGGYEGAGGQWLCFGGGVRFLGHGGLLEVPLRNLRVHVVRDEATLFTEQSDGSLFPLGALTLPEPTLSDDALVWEAASVVLSEAGGRFFGSQYPAGTVMDPLSISLPVGGSS